MSDQLHFSKEVKSSDKAKSGGLTRAGARRLGIRAGSETKSEAKKAGGFSKIKGKTAKRRESFCARMCGAKAKSSEKTKNDPDSRVNKSLRVWGCRCGARKKNSRHSEDCPVRYSSNEQKRAMPEKIPASRLHPEIRHTRLGAILREHAAHDDDVGSLARHAIESNLDHTKPMDLLPFHVMRDYMIEHPDHPLAQKFNWESLPEKMELDREMHGQLRNVNETAESPDELISPIHLHSNNIPPPGYPGYGVPDAIRTVVKRKFPFFSDKDLDDSAVRLRKRMDRPVNMEPGTEDGLHDYIANFWETKSPHPERYSAESHDSPKKYAAEPSRVKLPSHFEVVATKRRGGKPKRISKHAGLGDALLAKIQADSGPRTSGQTERQRDLNFVTHWVYSVYPDGSRKLTSPGVETGSYHDRNGGLFDHHSSRGERTGNDHHANIAFGSPHRRFDLMAAHIANMISDHSPFTGSAESVGRQDVVPEIRQIVADGANRRDPVALLAAADKMDDHGIEPRVSESIRKKVGDWVDNHGDRAMYRRHLDHSDSPKKYRLGDGDMNPVKARQIVDMVVARQKINKMGGKPKPIDNDIIDLKKAGVQRTPFKPKKRQQLGVNPAELHQNQVRAAANAIAQQNYRERRETAGQPRLFEREDPDELKERRNQVIGQLLPDPAPEPSPFRERKKPRFTDRLRQAYRNKVLTGVRTAAAITSLSSPASESDAAKYLDSRRRDMASLNSSEKPKRFDRESHTALARSRNSKEFHEAAHDYAYKLLNNGQHHTARFIANASHGGYTHRQSRDKPERAVNVYPDSGGYGVAVTHAHEGNPGLAFTFVHHFKSGEQAKQKAAQLVSEGHTPTKSALTHLNARFAAIGDTTSNRANETPRDQVAPEETQAIRKSRTTVDEPLKMDAYRAPVGGMIVRGQYYKGGRVVPDLEKFGSPPSRIAMAMRKYRSKSKGKVQPGTDYAR